MPVHTREEVEKESRPLILTQRHRETKKEDDYSSSFFLVPLPYGGARGGFPSLMEGSGVAFPPLWRGQGWLSLLLGGARGGLPLANTAGDSQAGGDGGQDGCYCLNDEFPSFLLHVSFFLRLVHFCLWNVEGGVRSENRTEILLSYTEPLVLEAYLTPHSTLHTPRITVIRYSRLHPPRLPALLPRSPSGT